MRILIADSLQIFRSGAHTLLARESDFEIVEAASLDELLRAVEHECPEIALIDLELPRPGGIAAVRALSCCCATKSIVWCFEPSPDIVLAALRAGAQGFLSKDISPDGLVRALRGVAHGQAPLSRDIASLMIDALHGLDEHMQARDRAAILTMREREVLDLIALGARNRQIALALTISELTVKRHVQNILEKLELPSRQAAATLYRTAVSPEEVPTAVARVV